ncbi:hypothetical protein I4U23_010042 [Adineta vaga]|nr:hypothetical protein I4U23_010042 [Adineta vaga]
MESFFRRMSSIVSKNSFKSTDVNENEQENSEEDYGRLRCFREMQERRKSAPDIHRRANATSIASMQIEENDISTEQMNLPRSTTTSKTNSTQFSRPHSNSTSYFQHSCSSATLTSYMLLIEFER